MEIETERLFIRPVQLEDLDQLAPLFADPEVMLFSLRGVRSFEETRVFIQHLVDETMKHQVGMCCVIEKNSQTLIGMCGIVWWETEGEMQPELGYRLAKKYWGKGFAFEACDAIQNHVGRENLVSFIEKENERSVRLAERLGGRWSGSRDMFGKRVEVYQY